MDCVGIRVVDGVEFRMRFFDKFREKRIPFTGQMEITTRCNLRCHHCYICDNNSKGELTLPEIRRIIDEVVDEGCLWLVLTGGEPLLRPDFLDIYTYAKQKGLFVVLFTNGTLLTEAIADYFKELPPYSIEISLYGLTESIYQSVTGVQGSFQRCMKGINMLVDRHLPLHLKTVAVTANQHEIGEIQGFAEKHHTGFRYDPLINPRVDGGMQPRDHRMTPEEVVTLDLQDPGRVEALRRLHEAGARWRRSEFFFDCGAGKKAFNVDSFGRLQLCALARRFSYDLRRGSFHDGWHRYFLEALNLKRDMSSGCEDCKLYLLCGMCPAWTELENGGKQGPSEYICKIAHLRATALASSVQNESEESRAVPLQT